MWAGITKNLLCYSIAQLFHQDSYHQANDAWPCVCLNLVFILFYINNENNNVFVQRELKFNAFDQC